MSLFSSGRSCLCKSSRILLCCSKELFGESGKLKAIPLIHWNLSVREDIVSKRTLDFVALYIISWNSVSHLMIFLMSPLSTIFSAFFM